MNITSTYFHLMLAALKALGGIAAIAANGSTQPGNNVTRETCSVTLRSLPSNPAAQSSISTVLFSSSFDPSTEFLCSAGSSYDDTGITCHVLQCPAPTSLYGGHTQGRSGFPDPYGGRPTYTQPYSNVVAITVGPQVAFVNTANPCWRLKQIRLNSYVYLVCFVRNYGSLVFQVIFKENARLEILHVETLIGNHLTLVGVGSFTTDDQFQCMAAVYSSFSVAKEDDYIHPPSDELAPIYYVCPNNYKWNFCGNVNVENTIDVSLWFAQSMLYAIFVQVRDVSFLEYYDGILPTMGILREGASLPFYQTTPLLQFSISPDVDLNVCATHAEKEIHAVGFLPPFYTENLASHYYRLCGVRKCTIAANAELTTLCCAVFVKRGCPGLGIINVAPALQYSSFCIPYDANSKKFAPEKVVFLETSDTAVDVFFLNSYKGSADCCQWIITASPAGYLKMFSFVAITASLANQTAPASVPPVNNFNEEKLFHNAAACSFKPKCCGSPDTCVTCTRPAKYGDKFLGALSCREAHSTHSSHGAQTSQNYEIPGPIPVPLPPYNDDGQGVPNGPWSPAAGNSFTRFPGMGNYSHLSFNHSLNSLYGPQLQFAQQMPHLNAPHGGPLGLQQPVPQFAPQ